MERSTLRKLLAVTVTVAAVGAAVALRSGPSERPAAPPDASTSGHHTGQDPASAEAYWTPERLREARPAPMPMPGEDG
ncbi:hypothetical protein [Streptomyces sp. NPDC053048]|uniref:hypothetical protein n=1 Tax=Streptomyces sp. NPDC053048 TaxID=3365694 RepID=UPI0037D6A426